MWWPVYSHQLSTMQSQIPGMQQGQTYPTPAWFLTLPWRFQGWTRQALIRILTSQQALWHLPCAPTHEIACEFTLQWPWPLTWSMVSSAKSCWLGWVVILWPGCWSLGKEMHPSQTFSMDFIISQDPAQPYVIHQRGKHEKNKGCREGGREWHIVKEILHKKAHVIILHTKKKCYY